MSFCNSDFCPGCGVRNGCRCEQEEAEANAQTASEAREALNAIAVPEMSAEDDAKFSAAMDALHSILSRYEID